MESSFFTLAQVADILGVSKDTLRRWDNNGTLSSRRDVSNNYRVYHRSQIQRFEQAQLLFESNWDDELKTVPSRSYKLIELFAGCGGLALGMEYAGLKSVLLNEIESDACDTLRRNRPNWNIIECDIKKINFKKFKNNIDILTGGFPCQAFSYAGKKLGFEDTRGTLFFEYARAINEIRPKVFLAENVRGLLKHNNGETLKTIRNVIEELGYKLIDPRVLKAMFFKVPQKRERLFLIGIRNDIADFVKFKWPSPYKRILTLKDALKAGELYHTDVPSSPFQKYPSRKKEILDHVPAGGYWKDLPLRLQKEYMMKSFYLGGGKTGMARRLSWDEPSLTLTTSPAQKQTERCHPDETRPLTIREYARIQTFPDDWEFSGSLASQYKQIGNAVPVNLAYAVGRSIVRLLNDIDAYEK